VVVDAQPVKLLVLAAEAAGKSTNAATTAISADVAQMGVFGSM
jgi:hypothetical protein